jgi:hypothetical protein
LKFFEQSFWESFQQQCTFFTILADHKAAKDRKIGLLMQFLDKLFGDPQAVSNIIYIYG